MNFKLCCVHGNCDRTYNVVVRSQTELDNKNSLIMYMYILSNISINILYAPFYRFPLLLTRRICL